MIRQFAALTPVPVLLASLGALGLDAPFPTLLLACVALAYVVAAAGRLATRGSGALPLASLWTLGVAVTGPVLYLLQVVLPLGAAAAFAIVAAGVLAIQLALKTDPAGASPTRIEIVGVLLCCAYAGVWCRDLAAAPAVLAAKGTLPAWVDYFTHGSVLSEFGDPRAAGQGAIALAGIPKPLYHYASYMLPAALAAPLDQPGLPLATSLWVPIGVLTLAGGALALGTALAGSAGGVAALLALFVLPDPSNYGLRNGYFSFHWNLFAHPGATFALGIALLSVALLQRWVQTRIAAALVLSAALVAVTSLFRMHVFLLLLPAWLITVAAASQIDSGRRWKWLLAAGAVAIAAVVALVNLPALPVADSWSFGEGRALERFLHQVHRNQEPTAYQGLYRHLQIEYGGTFALVMGALLIYPLALGAFLLLLPAAAWIERGSVRLRGIDAFPVALLAGFGALIAFAPTPSHQDSTDLIHRPSVLLYAVVAVWTAALLVRWLTRQGGDRSGTRLWQTLAVAAALGLPAMWISATDLAAPKFSWARRSGSYGYALERGLLESAQFVRARSRPGDRFATSVQTRSYIPVDHATVLAALSGAPAYLARPWVHVAQGGRRAEIASDRFNALLAIGRASDRQQALQRLSTIGVHWYIATARGVPAWDPAHEHSDFSHGNIAVYEARR